MSSEAKTNTGIPHKKLMMWLFLASDCMFFGTLISTHLIYRQLYPSGSANPGKIDILNTFNIELTSFSTFILLMSSFLMALAVSAIYKGDVRNFRRTTLGVILFGFIFLGCQVYEFKHFATGQGHYQYEAMAPNGQVLKSNPSHFFHSVPNMQKAKTAFLEKHPNYELKEFTLVKKVPALTLQNSIFGSTFYVLTGLHGIHVSIGVLWLILLLIHSYSKKGFNASNGINVESAGLYWHFVDIVWIIIFTVVYLLEYLKF